MAVALISRVGRLSCFSPARIDRAPPSCSVSTRSQEYPSLHFIWPSAAMDSSRKLDHGSASVSADSDETFAEDVFVAEEVQPVSADVEVAADSVELVLASVELVADSVLEVADSVKSPPSSSTSSMPPPPSSSAGKGAVSWSSTTCSTYRSKSKEARKQESKEARKEANLPMSSSRGSLRSSTGTFRSKAICAGVLFVLQSGRAYKYTDPIIVQAENKERRQKLPAKTRARKHPASKNRENKERQKRPASANGKNRTSSVSPAQYYHAVP